MKSGAVILAATAATLLCACTTIETGTVRYPDGAKKVVYDYTIDETGQTRNGRYREWYENGQKRFEGHYVDGERQGPWTEWYENGQKRFEGRYKDNRRLAAGW